MSTNTDQSEAMMKSHFKTKYKPEYAQLLKKHLEDGGSFQSFGGVAKVGNFTLYSWVKKHPEFKAVKDLYPHTQNKVYAPCSGCNVQHIV